jgi:hypothetical protein
MFFICATITLEWSVFYTVMSNSTDHACMHIYIYQHTQKYTFLHRYTYIVMYASKHNALVFMYVRMYAYNIYINMPLPASL